MTGSAAGWRARALATALLALGAAPLSTAAQATCDPGPLPVANWASPLDRTVTLHGGLLTLEEALDRITNAARLRLSYSPDLVPLERRACLHFTAAPVGAVLEVLLRGTAVAPVVAGAEHVVLAAAHGARAGAGELELKEPVVLDGIRVDVASPRPNNAAGVLATEIDGRLLELHGASTLAEALDGMVPGVWVWGSGAGNALAHYGSMRGVTSLGLNTPKLYIDGLEVANPLLVSSIDPATIERVEIIRGPQGAALFGGDAIGGVTHIITRQGAIDASGSRATLRSGLGVASSAFSSSGALEQDHALTLFTGRADRSARLDAAFASLGDYVPDAASRRISAVGAARTVGGRFALSGTARFLSESTTLLESPLLRTTSAPLPSGAPHDLAVGQYTAGITAAYRTDRWLHTAVVGVNGYALGGAPTLAEAATTVDSALATAGRSAFRTTLRLTSTTRRPLGAHAEAGITFALDHSALRQDGGAAVAAWSAPYQHGSTTESLVRPNVMPGSPGGALTRREGPGRAGSGGYVAPSFPAGSALAAEEGRRRGTIGISSRLDGTLFDRVDLSAGLRFEETRLENGAALAVALPSLGASWQLLANHRVGLALRASYGRGLRWPQVASTTGFVRTLLLAPEVQSGTEAGFDLAIGQALSFQATRFDQVATGLTQQVSVPRDSGTTAPLPLDCLLQAQAVGSIANRGWEFSAVARRGALTLSSSLSLLDSYVRELAPGYAGDLAAGDRVLGVPARTASVSALWSQPGWSAALSLARAFDWYNYDRIGIARAQADSIPLTTAQLRDYWLHYHGSTRVRATVSRDFASRFTLRLTGDNLLDVQTGEPDNATIVPGRTISLSVRARL